MKKFLVAVMALVAFGATTVMANDAAYFTAAKDNTRGGYINGGLVFIYDKHQEIGRATTKEAVPIMKKITVEGICKKPLMSKAISEGLTVTYIYMFKESTMIVVVDNCPAK